ncbi:hypothetical protein [Paenibacillus paeoniae]|uniref:Uncharacterized protein n=1 Tax=Paenibacillus paeoniae TaxID=2292705 RepID=A0A371PK56_9BACL|nr:hypothetical protein [Paenibacillus paeoniae]REK76315.1 hypothetical protein DX130_04515 [Paenibacillus paeoniae]
MDVSLLYNWEDSVENFLKWASHCCGIKKDSALYRELKVHIKTINDLELFIDLYDGNMNSLDSTLHKIKSHQSKSVIFNDLTN